MLPARFGGQQTISAFNNELGKHVRLICLCSKNNVAEGHEAYTVIPDLPVSKLQMINPFVWMKVADVIKREHITHIIIEHPYHAIAGWICRKRFGCKIIHYSHNIEYRRFKELKKWYWRLVKKEELWLGRFADLNICVTKEDADALMKETGTGSEKFFHLPHAVSKKNMDGKAEARNIICERHGISPNTSILLFNGTLDYRPNYDAVIYICNNIVPVLKKEMKHFVVLITGRCKTFSLQIPSSVAAYVKYAGEVNNVEQYFLAANVYINPVQTGEGVQTKTLEALSYNLNTVCYQPLVRGILVNLVKEKLFIAGNISEFISHIHSALQKNNVITDAFFSFYSYNHHFPSFLDKLKQL